MSEQVFYNDPNVTVTNARFICFGKTHAMSGITAVSVLVESPSYVGPIIMAIIGLILLACESWIPGLVFLAIAILWFISKKSVYHLVLESASGSQTACSSKDAGYIKALEDAINNAIIARG